jgi:hypothetical protein
LPVGKKRPIAMLMNINKLKDRAPLKPVESVVSLLRMVMRPFLSVDGFLGWEVEEGRYFLEIIYPSYRWETFL